MRARGASSLRFLAFGAALLVVLAWASACTRGEEAPRVINGAGATLPYPLYARWSAEYAKLDPKVRINYQSVGSGAGIRQLTDGVVDFGATDEPLDPGRLARGEPVLHVPTTVGAVAMTFSLPGAPALLLPADVLADVFLGVITRWDDPRLRAANPGTELPSEAITVVHRADGSGTSAAFAGFLARSSEAWRTRVGVGTSPRFPVGVGMKGNEGVAEYVKKTPFALGYLEVAHARLVGLPAAAVQNPKGAFVTPSLEALDHAIRGTSEASAYPITALSYVVVPREARDAARGGAVAKFLWWAVHDGQRYARSLDYVELPPELVSRAEAALHELRADGRFLLPAGG
jgi:phosphate transport system substrate-binding protein